MVPRPHPSIGVDLELSAILCYINVTVRVQPEVGDADGNIIFEIYVSGQQLPIPPSPKGIH